MTAPELIKRLEAAGWVEVRQSGSHKTFKKAGRSEVNLGSSPRKKGLKAGTSEQTPKAGRVEIDSAPLGDSNRRLVRIDLPENQATNHPINQLKWTKKVDLVIERGEDEEIAGSVDTADFFFTTVGETEADVIENIRSQISDFLQNEGKDNPAWESVKASDIEFTIEYDLTALFLVFNAIKINSIAELAGINKGLLRQYASGVKSASAQQAKKVETAVRQLGERLLRVIVG